METFIHLIACVIIVMGSIKLLDFMLRHFVGIFFACVCIFTFLALTG